MMDVQSVREAIALPIETAMTPGHWNVYAFTPGAPSLPAVVVGLPESITPNRSAGLAEIEFPVFVLHTLNNDRATEAALFEMSLTVHTALSGAESQWWSSLRVGPVEQFSQVAVGAAQAVGCRIPVNVLTRK